MTIEAEWECTVLSSRYAFYADRARHLVADLFTEDATLELVGRSMRGRDEIRAGMAPRPGLITLHFCCNTIIEVLDSNNARGTTYLLSFGQQEESQAELPLAMPAPRTGGIYFDEFRRVDGRWLFSKRQLSRFFTGPR